MTESPSSQGEAEQTIIRLVRTIVGIAGPEGPTADLIARPMGMDETAKNKNRTDPIMGFSAEDRDGCADVACK